MTCPRHAAPARSSARPRSGASACALGLAAVLAPAGCFDPEGAVSIPLGDTGATTGDDGLPGSTGELPESTGELPESTGNLPGSTGDAPESTSTGEPVMHDDCGNAMIDGDEACDGDAFVDGDSCADVGLGLDTESLHCTSACELDFSECSSCGDGTVTSPEACEAGMLGGATCESEGFDGGTLQCAANCTFDTSGCEACGDGSLGTSEACDGDQLGGASCRSQGFVSGTLGCAVDCTFDVDACIGAGCGNGIVEADEECDGSAAGHTCVGETGLPDGDVSCTAGCTLDTSDCSGPAARRVFVSSEHFPANFGSAMAGDAVCQSIADDVGLGGTWRAWLSDAATTPVTRFNHSDTPYRLLDGTTIADDWADLVDGNLDAAIGITESGGAVDAPSTTVATATTASGTLQAFNGTCQDWTSNLANATAGVGNEENTITWSDSGAVACTTQVSLYCFEQ